MASKKKAVAMRVKRMYGEVVNESTVKLLRPLKNGDESLTTPLISRNGIWRDHGIGSHVMVSVQTNEDKVIDPDDARYTVQDIVYIPDDQTFALVATHIENVDAADLLTDILRDALLKYKYVLNVEEANKIFISWSQGVGEYKDYDGVILADQGGFPGLLELLEIIVDESQASGDHLPDDVLSCTIVDENNVLLKNCVSITDLYSEDTSVVVANVEWMNGYYVPEKIRNIVTAINGALKFGDGYFTLFAGGESGSGKTEFGRGLAKHLGLDFVKINCQSITDPEAWFAERKAQDGTTEIVKTRLANMLDRGECVVLLDEINRIPPDLANPLMPVLDDSRHYELAGDLNALGTQIIFILTANIGAEYSGTHAIDAAFSNRVNATVRFGRLPVDIEREIIKKRFDLPNEDIKDIMMHMDQFRTYTNNPENYISADLSTRASLNVAFLIKCGSNIYDAFRWAIINCIPDEEMPKDLADYIRMNLNQETVNITNKRF